MHTYWRYRRAVPGGRPVLRGSCARPRDLRRQRDLRRRLHRTATGVLTLVDFYVDDNGIINYATFISFEYSSSSRNFGITLAMVGVLAAG
jgi:hypothetical protein